MTDLHQSLRRLDDAYAEARLTNAAADAVAAVATNTRLAVAVADVRLAIAVTVGSAYRYRPGPPVDETAWLREGVIRALPTEGSRSR